MVKETVNLPYKTTLGQTLQRTVESTLIVKRCVEHTIEGLFERMAALTEAPILTFKRMVKQTEELTKKILLEERTVELTFVLFLEVTSELALTVALTL